MSYIVPLHRSHAYIRLPSLAEESSIYVFGNLFGGTLAIADKVFLHGTHRNVVDILDLRDKALGFSFFVWVERQKHLLHHFATGIGKLIYAVNTTAPLDGVVHLVIVVTRQDQNNTLLGDGTVHNV